MSTYKVFRDHVKSLEVVIHVNRYLKLLLVMVVEMFGEKRQQRADVAFERGIMLDIPKWTRNSLQLSRHWRFNDEGEVPQLL